MERSNDVDASYGDRSFEFIDTDEYWGRVKEDISTDIKTGVVGHARITLAQDPVITATDRLRSVETAVVYDIISWQQSRKETVIQAIRSDVPVPKIRKYIGNGGVAVGGASEYQE